MLWYPTYSDEETLAELSGRGVEFRKHLEEDVALFDELKDQLESHSGRTLLILDDYAGQLERGPAKNIEIFSGQYSNFYHYSI